MPVIRQVCSHIFSIPIYTVYIHSHMNTAGQPVVKDVSLQDKQAFVQKL